MPLTPAVPPGEEITKIELELGKGEITYNKRKKKKK
jgi:hypothetical protein